MQWKRDSVVPGMIFLGLAMLFGGSSLTLDIGTPDAMGPGFFPLALCLILAVLAGAIIVAGRDKADEAHHPIPWRAVFLVLGAPVAFGLTVRGLGLLPALIITPALAVAASRNIRPLGAAATIAGMTVFCIVVFYYGLGMTVELVNSRFFN